MFFSIEKYIPFIKTILLIDVLLLYVTNIKINIIYLEKIQIRN